MAILSNAYFTFLLLAMCMTKMSGMNRVKTTLMVVFFLRTPETIHAVSHVILSNEHLYCYYHCGCCCCHRHRLIWP